MAKKEPASEPNTIIVEDEALRAGFTQIPNLVLRRPSLTPGAKLTYMVLLSYAWQADSCFPGHDRMALDMGVSRRSIVTYLKELQDYQLVQVQRRGLGLTNIYRLVKLSSVPPDPRSAKFAHQEVQKTTHQEVQDLHTKKYSVEEDSEEEDIDLSNIRKAKPTEHNDEGKNNGDESHARTRSRRSHARPQDSAESSKTGFQRVGDLLLQSDQKHGSTGRTTRQKAYSEDRQRILAYIDDFAVEMGDEAPLQSSVSRVYNLYQRSGLPIDAFTSLMYEARALTKEYAGNVKKKRGDQGAFGVGKNKFPYFMKILEERIKSSSAQLPLVPEDVWDEAQKILETSVAQGVYDEHIAPLLAKQRAGELVLFASTEYEADWIGQRLGQRIKEAVETAGWNGPIVIRVAEDGGEEESSPVSDSAL